MSRATPQGALKLMLVAQIGIGAALLWIDLNASARSGATAPQLFAPPGTGPETRPYAPDRRPGTPAMREMPQRLEFGTEGAAMTLIGQIAPGDAQRFTDYIEAKRAEGARPTALQIDSSGGSVADALAIGRQVRALAMTTAVGEGAVCLSACPYILAGGTTRSADPAAVVGVHQHYFGENTLLPAFLAVEDVQRGQGAVIEYLDEMGVDTLLMAPALKTPPDEIFVLDAEDLRRYRLVTDAPDTEG
ncbi:hypothetical protein [Frigidibacter albus]|uniref:COG3904 family protein n=1 Tax=Frigidibacter albus TaxID=1465486 RepID=UPI001E514C88|nr:hypothetical protein [Frigidibacter albus]